MYVVAIAETCVVDGASNCIERMLRGGEMERRGGWYGMETCVVDGARCVPLPARSRAIYMLHGHPRTSRFALMYGVMEVASCGRVSLRRLRALSSTLLCHLSAAWSSPHISLRSDVRGYGGGVLRTGLPSETACLVQHVALPSIRCMVIPAHLASL